MIARTLLAQNNNKKALKQILPKVCRSSSTSTSTISFPDTTTASSFTETNATLTFADLQNNQKSNNSDKLRDDLTLSKLRLSSPGTVLSNQTLLSPDFQTFGIQVHPVEAASIAKTNHVVDKILIFISHGETVTKEDAGESEIDLTLTGKVRLAKREN